MPVLKRHLNVFKDEVEVLAGINVGKMWDRMMGEFLGEFERLSRQQLSEAALERELLAFMEGLSDKRTADVARQSSTVAYNQGRNASLMSAKSRKVVRFVVRSEVLDTNTCRPCSLLDGEIFEVGSSEYFANMPPAQCDGGDRCRGFYIAITEAAA